MLSSGLMMKTAIFLCDFLLLNLHITRTSQEQKFSNRSFSKFIFILNKAMDSNEFRKRGTEMVEYICQYLETLGDRRVTPSVEPGYLRQLIPGEAPVTPESWDKIMEDVESKIMPGVTHWQHPRFHAYFPSGNSYPSILGDMLGDAIGCIGFSWVGRTLKSWNHFYNSFFH